MSFREITMQEIEEVLRRKLAGQSQRRIARETGLDRKTVKRYFDEAAAQGLTGAAATEAEAAWVGHQVQSRPAPEASAAWQTLSEKRDRIDAWLTADKPLRLIRVHELLAREGMQVSYTTLRRFARRELGWRKRQPTAVILGIAHVSRTSAAKNLPLRSCGCTSSLPWPWRRQVVNPRGDRWAPYIFRCSYTKLYRFTNLGT